MLPVFLMILFGIIIVLAVSLTSREAATRKASARRSWSRMVTVSLTRSPGEFGCVYQSVMITPVLASAWSSGAKETVSRAARQR